MKYKNILFFITIITLVACSNSKNRNILNEKIIIKYIDSIKKEIQFSEKKMFYSLGPTFTPSYYEVRLNDIIITQKFFNGNDDKSSFRDFININNALKKDGEQKLTFKAFPTEGELLKSNDWIDIEIEKIDSTNNDTIIYSHEIPPESNDEKSKLDGLKIFEDSFEFNTSMPFEKQYDWFTSEKISEQNNIEKEVVEAYKSIMNLYKNGDTEELLKLYAPIFKDEYYLTKITEKDLYGTRLHLERYIPFLHNCESILDENYELKFYAEGRLATLEKKKKNLASYNESALSIEYDLDFEKIPDGDRVRYSDFLLNEKGIIPKKKMEIYLFFHKPKGAKNLQLATDVFRDSETLNED